LHVELATATEAVSASPNHFGDEAEPDIDSGDAGLPGALPVLNRQGGRAGDAHSAWR